MIVEFTQDRFQVKPLTQQAAKALGHVYWLEETDPVQALVKMAKAIKNKPINCAVWANAGDSLSTEFKAAIRKWRGNSTLEARFAFTNEGRLFGGVDDARSNLQKYFKEAAQQPNLSDLDCRAYAFLQHHVEHRMSEINKAFLPKEFTYQVRSEEQTMSGQFVPHTDGKLGAIRAIESIESVSSWLISNTDAHYGLPGEEYETYLRTKAGWRDEKTIQRLMQKEEWFLNTEGELTFWETPVNSLILFTE